MLKEELLKRQQMLQVAQEMQKMRDEQKKGIQMQGQKMSQEVQFHSYSKWIGIL